LVVEFLEHSITLVKKDVVKHFREIFFATADRTEQKKADLAVVEWSSGFTGKYFPVIVLD
jgi:hypothetical protein